MWALFTQTILFTCSVSQKQHQAMLCILVKLMEWTIADTAIAASTFKLNILVDSCLWINGWLTRVCCDRLAAYYRFDTTPVTLIVVTLGTLYYGNKQAQFIKARALPWCWWGWWTVKWCEAYWGITSGRNAPSAPQQLQHFCSIVHNHTFELLRLIHTHSLIQSRPQYEWHGPSIMSGLHLTYSPFCHPHTVNHCVSLGLDSPYWGKCIGNRQLNSSTPCYPQNDPFCDMSHVIELCGIRRLDN